jgi:hypothetical protein
MTKATTPAYVKLIVAYCDAVDKAKINLAELREYFAGDSPDLVRESIIGAVAKHYKVPLVEGQRKAAGTLVLDKKAPQYEAAKKQLWRLVTDITKVAPKKSKNKKRTDKVKELLDLAKKLTPEQLKSFKAQLRTI